MTGFYLLLDLAVIAFPLALSFDRKVAYWRRWPRVLLSAAIVAVPFLVWDALMTHAGAWSFSPKWAGRGLVAGMPAAEVLFFLAVPFSCLFLYEVVGAYGGDRRLPPVRLPWLIAAAALGLAALLLRGRLYTATILAATALLLALAAVLRPALLVSRRFWVALLLTYLPFLLVNGVLTGIPVVSYAEEAILGLRAGPIPVEDFLYSFTLLASCILVYDGLGSRKSNGRF